mgnify:CR=1 FL=1
MADDQKKIVPIDYTHRDFETIRDDLMQMAERFYPDTFQDFSEGSFGAIMLDAVAYVGDQLSFYLDYNVNESFLDTAYQYTNVLRHGRILGYKPTGPGTSYGTVVLYILVPASSTGLGPDTAYIPLIKAGTRFSSKTGINFLLTENVDFSDSSFTTVVAQTNTSTGAPTYYAIKGEGSVVSGYFDEEVVRIGAYERFKKARLKSKDIVEIISVTDAAGNEYFEVDYLSQDIVYKEVSNKNYKNDNVPSILKPYLVSRKFVLERDTFGSYLQFGSGKSGQSNVVADVQSVALDIFGKDYVTSTTFDPSRLTENENFGIVPSNTVLYVAYRAIDPVNTNVGVEAINTVAEVSYEFEDQTSLSGETINIVINSLEVSNEEPIVGVSDNINSTELKRRIYDTFPTQNRAVTQADYENVAYRMPAKYGSVQRVSVQKDPDSLKRNLNMYVISTNQRDKLIATNSTIKNNLKTWLNNYRMINDTIDILDPYIINLGIEFVIKSTAAADKYTLLDSAITALTNKYSGHFYIGESFNIADIYNELREVSGILDVVQVKIVNKNSANYSGVMFDINKNTSPDGIYVYAPKNAIFEIKYPTDDIKGKVK